MAHLLLTLLESVTCLDIPEKQEEESFELLWKWTPELYLDAYYRLHICHGSRIFPASTVTAETVFGGSSIVAVRL